MFTKTGNERSLIFISTLIYFLVAICYIVISTPSGDEPHYLLMSVTLIKYHSLDVMKAYEHKDYLSFDPGTLDLHMVRVQGRMVSWHGIGAPILWLIPFLLFGRLGAIWFMAAVSVLIILNIYRLLLAMEIPQRIAFEVSLALALASPLCIYAHMTFVEPIGALVCIYILRKFIESDVSLSALLLSSILLGLLPWVNVRFIPIEVPLFFLLLLRLYQQYRLHNMLSYIAYILPIALLTLGLEVFNWLFTGSLNPAIALIKAHPGPYLFALSPFMSLFGLLFDQDAGLLVCFPLSAFLVAGLLLSAKKRYLTYNLAMLAISVPYLLTICTFTGWHGGWSPPARYVSVLLPVWSFYLACVWQQVKGRFMVPFVRILFWWGVVYNLLSLLPTRNGFIDPRKHNYLLAPLHIGNFYLINFWPLVPNADSDWNAAKSYHLISIGNVIWIAAYLLLTLFFLYQVRSNRDKRGEPTKLNHSEAQVQKEMQQNEGRDSQVSADYPRVSVVVPAQNEAKNLQYVLPHIPCFVTEVILVDGHSDDDTLAMAQQLLPTIHIIKQIEKGKGDALRLGFAACSGDIIITLDADGSTDPSEIPKFVEALLAGNDFAKGSRFVQNAGSRDLTWVRRLGCLGLDTLASLLFRTRFSDISYGYYAFWRYCLDSVDIDCDGFEVEALIKIRMHKAKLKIIDVPSMEKPRIYGESHLNIFRDGWRFFKTIVKERCKTSTQSQVHAIVRKGRSI